MSMQLQRTLAWMFIGLTAVLLVMQMRSLFMFPQPNSFRWFGDETWLMTEAKQQITMGVVRYPLAIGSTLEHGKGLVLSMTWLSALLYGLPLPISSASAVAVGRMVTAVLSIVLLIALYKSARSLGSSQFGSALSVLFLVSTRAFIFSSHSARPDLLAGLIVVGFVTVCTRFAGQEKISGVGWWFGYGAIIVFLAFSSSIHLLTLLCPVSLYFFWRVGGTKQWNYTAYAIAGVIGMMALLIFIYYITSGNLTLFSTGAGHVQFHDVLSSIPILRPFSRSVQVSNLIIRWKQFASESPQIFLFPILLPLVWRRGSHSQHTFAIAAIIVVLSWLLLEGAEINYLIQILPLLFLGLAIAATVFIERWKYFATMVLSGLAIVFFFFGFRDSLNAHDAASKIDQSNRVGVHAIEVAISSDWRGPAKPRVISEPITLDRLSQDTNIEVMTDHFISFPMVTEPLDSFLLREHVHYAVLYNSPVYPKNRAKDDPFYQNVEHSGTLIATYIGTSGDMGRNYFARSNWNDTVLLFRLVP